MAWPMWHPLCPGQSALALSGGIAALREPSKVSNLEATIIACLWPNAWTGSIRRGTPRPTGVIYGGQVLLWPHTNFHPQLLGRWENRDEEVWGVEAAAVPQTQITVPHHALTVLLYPDPRASIWKSAPGTINHIPVGNDTPVCRYILKVHLDALCSDICKDESCWAWNGECRSKNVLIQQVCQMVVECGRVCDLWLLQEEHGGKGW